MKTFIEGDEPPNSNKKCMELELELKMDMAIRASLKELTVNELKIVTKQILALTHCDD